MPTGRSRAAQIHHPDEAGSSTEAFNAYAALRDPFEPAWIRWRSAAMNTCHTLPCREPNFELRFVSLFNDGRALAFPCDGTGRVDLDALSERARCNYFFARTSVGREYACPAVQARLVH
jgi:hypothetical protein